MTFDRHNPYAAPQAPLPTPVERAATETDAADLYVQSVPPPLVRGLVISLVAMGVMFLFMTGQIVVVTASTPFARLFAFLLGGVGVLHFGVVWGVRRGSVVMAFVGIAVGVLGALLSLRMLASILGLFPLLGMGVPLVNAVLLGVASPRIRAMGVARRALRKQGI